MIQFKSRSLAAALALGLATLVAAPAHAVTGFGAATTLNLPVLGPPLTDGGQGNLAASRSFSISSDSSSFSAYAEASLAGGTLHAANYASTAPCASAPGTCMGFGTSSRAAMWDMVTFTQADGSPMESVTLIPSSVEIDGMISGRYAYAKFRSYFGYDSDIDPDTLEWVDLTQTRTEILDNLFVPLTTAPMFIYLELWTYAGAGGVVDTQAYADFGNTLHFNWELPDGVVAHSESGQFLTGATSAVPEPGAWALMIVGFGLVGATLRRRNTLLAA